MKVLICGDRDWTDSARIAYMLDRYHHQVSIRQVIEGAARGADQMAGEIASGMGIPVVEYPAQWGLYGKAAGNIRNQQMLDEGKPDFILAFHNDIQHSKGTKDMIARAKHKIPVILITSTDIRIL